MNKRLNKQELKFFIKRMKDARKYNVKDFTLHILIKYRKLKISKYPLYTITKNLE